MYNNKYHIFYENNFLKYVKRYKIYRQEVQ